MRHPTNPTDATQNPTSDDDAQPTDPETPRTHPDTPPHEPERDPTADIHLEGQITDTPTGPEITIYPTDATGATILTTWLTLDANALCDTHDWR